MRYKNFNFSYISFRRAVQTMPMLNIIIKTIIIYIVLFLAMRVMGQRQSGQLQPYELVITLIIAEVASTPMDNPGIPLFYGLVPAATLILLYYFFSFLCLKSRRMRSFICGSPSILIHNGKVQYGEIKRIGYNMSDMIEQLRLKGQTNIANIHYAILETNGPLSVLPFGSSSPVTPSDMDLEVPEKGTLCSAIVLDGSFNPPTLKRLNLDEQKALKLLHTLGYSNLKDVVILTISEAGDVFVQDKNGSTRQITLPSGLSC